MGAIATAFTAAFPDSVNVAKGDCRGLGGTIETFLAAPFDKWSLNATAVASLPAAPAGWIVRIVGADAANARYLVDAFAGVPIFTARRANGTGAAPSAVQNADVLFRLEGFGYGATGMSGAGRANIEARATQNWTDTAQGCRLVFQTTANGAFAAADAGYFDQDGKLYALFGLDVSGSIEATGSIQLSPPTTKTGNYTVVDTDSYLIFNSASSITLTLPAAASYPGRQMMVKSIGAGAVVSASSNVVPRNSATAGTALLAAGSGFWAILVSDGTNWVVMAAN